MPRPCQIPTSTNSRITSLRKTSGQTCRFPPVHVHPGQAPTSYLTSPETTWCPSQQKMASSNLLPIRTSLISMQRSLSAPASIFLHPSVRMRPYNLHPYPNVLARTCPRLQPPPLAHNQPSLGAQKILAAFLCFQLRPSKPMHQSAHPSKLKLPCGKTSSRTRFLAMPSIPMTTHICFLSLQTRSSAAMQLPSICQHWKSTSATPSFLAILSSPTRIWSVQIRRSSSSGSTKLCFRRPHQNRHCHHGLALSISTSRILANLEQSPGLLSSKWQVVRYIVPPCSTRPASIQPAPQGAKERFDAVQLLKYPNNAHHLHNRLSQTTRSTTLNQTRMTRTVCSQAQLAVRRAAETRFSTSLPMT